MNDQTSPQLTLVVTAHHTWFLAEALACVAAQTIDTFDLVCCADTTGDPRVGEIFRSFLPKMRCERTQVVEVAGGTAGRVRNAGFSAARTPWVAYLDGDDVLRSDALAVLVDAIAADDCDIISTGMQRIHRDGRRELLPRSLTYRPPRWIYHTDPETVGHPTFFNQLLAIRSRLWAAHPFGEDTNGEDIDFMLHQLLAGRFRKVPVPVYYYRDTPGSFSKQDFPGGDDCTRRYRVGYYGDLFARRYRDEVAGNFADEPEPRS